MNVSWVVWYKEQIKGQKLEEVELVKIDEVEESKIEKILNKRKIREVFKYLVQWKEFIAENDTWKKRIYRM